MRSLFKKEPVTSMPGPLTKKELEVAQFFHVVATRAEELASAAGRSDDGSALEETAHALDGLHLRAQNAFVLLVGRPVTSVDLYELHVDEPATWTQRPMNPQGRR